MCFALFMVMLDNTVVNVALPSIQRDLHASISGLEWTVNAYTLAFAVLLVTGGRLGDIFGRRRMFLIGVVVFGALERLHRLLPERGVAGHRPRHPGRRRRVHDARDAVDHRQRVPAAGARHGDRHVGRRQRAGAGHRPGRRRLPRRERLLAVDLLPQRAGRRSSPSPSRSSATTSRATRPSTHHVDIPGVVTLTVGLAALVLALVEGNRGAGARRAIVGLLVVAAASAGRLRRRRDARARRRWSTSRSSARARSWAPNIVAFIVSFAMLAMFFFLALYMQNVRGYCAAAGRRAVPALDRRDHRHGPDRRAPGRPHRPASR